MTPGSNKRPASGISGKKGKQVNLFSFFNKAKNGENHKKVILSSANSVTPPKSPDTIVNDKKKLPSSTSLNEPKLTAPASKIVSQATQPAILTPKESSARKKLSARCVSTSRSSRRVQKQSAASNKDRQRRRQSLEDTDGEEEHEWEEEEKNGGKDSASEYEAGEEEEEDFLCHDDGSENDDESPAPSRKKRKTNSGSADSSASSPGLSSVKKSIPWQTTPTGKNSPSAGLTSFTCTTTPPGEPPPAYRQEPASIGKSCLSHEAHGNNKKSDGPPKFVENALNPVGSHVHNHLKFIQNPKDASKRSVDDPNYNSRTLFVDHAEWRRVTGKEMTVAGKMWWDIKSEYFDTVLFFKAGKFYELFHMDADIGVKVLGLSMMKGHIARAGVPEKIYGAWANRLVQAGYKVARVEQTETPEMQKARKAKALNHETCSILTLGTRTANYLDNLKEEEAQEVGPLMAIAERPIVPQQARDDGDACLVREFGVTLIDAPRGIITMAQFKDDSLCSHLQTLFAAYSPSEFLYQENDVQGSSKQHTKLKSLLVAYTASCPHPCRMEVVRYQEPFPKSFALDPDVRLRLERSSPTKPWNVDETIHELNRRNYFEVMPENLNAAIERAGANEMVLASFGAALYTLQRNLVDSEILSMGTVHVHSMPFSTLSLGAMTPINQDDHLPMDVDNTVAGEIPVALSTTPSAPSTDALSMEGTTLHSLEVIANASDGKVAGSLWSILNHTKTPHGSRMLKAWVLRPLFDKAQIDRRADAVQELATGAGSFALKSARNVLSKCGDIERLLSRIHSMGSSGTGSAAGHPDERALMYEEAEYTKRKVGDFHKILSGLKEASRIPEIFAEIEITSPLLAKIVRHPDRGGCFPNIDGDLDWFFENFDCGKAAQGLFEPSVGVDAMFDEANETRDQIIRDLDHFKQEMARELRTSEWTYLNVKPDSKDKYLIQVPASTRVPDGWVMKGKKGKGAKQLNKYLAPEVATLIDELERVLEVIAERKTKAVQLIFAKFDAKRDSWQAVAAATAMLDALGSLAQLPNQPGYSRPHILELETTPVFSCKQGRHPCVSSSSITSEFIPNDLELGTEQNPERVLLLSGPNMGGKSTFLRQTCLIAIMAQIGSFVPAEECRMTPVDRIYTRLGASDRILLGQSTFFVELSETASALRGATNRSLVIMDELGRGTSTFDGTAIAHAAVKHLVNHNKCLALFATHYHSLLDDWSDNPLVRLGHMECMVENDGDDGPSRVTFLYTLGKGACPKSFGINVARLAGLPNEILAKAQNISQEFEELVNAGSLRAKMEQAAKKADFELLRRLWQELHIPCDGLKRSLPS